jgi:hypothetical protein
MLGALIFEGLSPVEAHRKQPFRNLDHRSFGSGRLLQSFRSSEPVKLTVCIRIEHEKEKDGQNDHAARPPAIPILEWLGLSPLRASSEHNLIVRVA